MELSAADPLGRPRRTLVRQSAILTSAKGCSSGSPSPTIPPTDLGHPDNAPYTRSKTIAERVAWDELTKLSRPLEWVAINPGLVLGTVLDKDASASVELVAKMLRGELPGLPRLSGAIVDVRDIADLHLRAMTGPKAAGQRYIGAGEVLSMSQIAGILKSEAAELSAKVPTKTLPDWLVRIFGLFDKEVGGLMFELGKVRHLNSAKAMRELGWKSRPAAETLIATARSLQAVGALSMASDPRRC